MDFYYHARSGLDHLYSLSHPRKHVIVIASLFLKSTSFYPGDKTFTDPPEDSILKRRDITLPIKVCLVKAMVFAVVMYGCESWTVKKAEC